MSRATWLSIVGCFYNLRQPRFFDSGTRFAGWLVPIPSRRPAKSLYESLMAGNGIYAASERQDAQWAPLSQAKVEAGSATVGMTQVSLCMPCGIAGHRR